VLPNSTSGSYQSDDITIGSDIGNIFSLGGYIGGTDNFDGKIDELRISTIQRSVFTTSLSYPTEPYLEIGEPDDAKEWRVSGELRNTDGFLDHFNDSSPTANLTLVGNENQTAYVALPKYAVVTGMKMNIAGSRIGGTDEINETTVSLWHLDEGSGITSKDAANHYNISFRGGGEPQWTPDSKMGAYAVRYDGLDDYMYNTDIFDNVPENNTVEFWFKPNITMDENYTNSPIFVEIGGVSGKVIHIRWDGNLHVIRFYIENGGYNLTDYVGTLNAGQWYHLAFTWGKGGMNIFVDGTKVANNTATRNIIPNSAFTFKVGIESGSIKGVVDEIKVSNVQKTNYSFGSTGYPSDIFLEVGTPDGNYEWNHSGTFSGAETIIIPTAAMNSALSTCTPDANKLCTIPLLFHSNTSGGLNLSRLNVTYSNISRTP
ncbi:MAG: hypothetical protein A3D92_10140, partial [Bacteroidetes bacterium RIFCSPHIGHO2_02_FULL_44_7]